MSVSKRVPSTKTAHRRMVTSVSEIILENFMSYEYARIPFKQGLNIICGPNGAGKSSILLAVSVALGQVYTERSRKLSDLIRRGKDTARVSLIFDNRPVDGKRPIPFSRSDTFMLSRYLKRDGSYWYEADYREVSKSEVTRLFGRAGINPDNMLIIMHQGMVEGFSVTTPQEKLKMVEEAVGFREYREKVLSSQKKLEELVSEEGSLVQILEDAGKTAEYWKDLYDKYLLKKSLIEKRQHLERELIWANAVKLENNIRSLEQKLLNRESLLNDTQKKIEETGEAASKSRSNLDGAQTGLRKLYFSLVKLEKQAATFESGKKIVGEIHPHLNEAIRLLQDVPLNSDGTATGKKLQERIEDLRFFVQNQYTQMEEQRRLISDLNEEVNAIQEEIGKAEKDVDKITNRYIDLKVEEAVLQFKRRNLQQEINELNRSLKAAKEELAAFSPRMEEAQPRIATERTPAEVSEEIRINAAHLRTVEGVPEEAERMYTDYTTTYGELKEKLQTLSTNKEIALKEVEERKKLWRESIQRLLAEVNPLYQDVISKIGGTGVVKISDLEDVEAAGLDLWIGFRGASPAILDAYTQSGGERSVAIIAFLLSLQSSVVSPFRAVDEFDVHMDPRNREAIFRMIFQYVKEAPLTQYLVITPSQLTVTDPTAHMIFVQNVRGHSEVKEVLNRS
ncbi:MAG: AAA family ATPase [Thaumarchaeota archaeon]|nr:AAA family ATPase [Nitrososphaerota archaeon]MCL5318491.1 AAA family ATPase [Nitrososphaerota archaeon]